FYWSIRQPRIAELECHFLHRQAKTLGGNLRHDRVGAGSDVFGRARDCEPAVGLEHGLCACLLLEGDPGRAGHAPSDEIVTVADRARSRVPTRPPKSFGALLVTGAQLFARKWLVVVVIPI